MRPDKHRQRGGGVRPDGHETGVAERELARVTVDEVQADCEHDVDADAREHVCPVRVDLVLEVSEHRAGGERDQEPGAWARKHQTFSGCSLPSNPAGRNSRISINSTNEMAS